MTAHHQDKDGKPVHVGDLVHFSIDGRPYSGVVHALVRRDHEPAIMTIVQLFLPATAVSKELPETPKRGLPQTDPTSETNASVEQRKNDLAIRDRRDNLNKPQSIHTGLPPEPEKATEAKTPSAPSTPLPTPKKGTH